MIATRKHPIDVVIAPAAPEYRHQPTGAHSGGPVGLVFYAPGAV